MSKMAGYDLELREMFGDEAIDGPEQDEEDTLDEDYDDSMDGDHASALASAGWGTDEDYGYYGGEEY